MCAAFRQFGNDEDAIYVRDPNRKLVDEQLNGGEFARIAEADWKLIQPYLEENERLFGITVDRLLTVADQRRAPQDVYRKIMPKKTAAPAKADPAGVDATVGELAAVSG